jgi:hypothetical protein
MASEKQLRANRKNAKKSTGPRTAAGRLNSSRNALRHGLSVSLIPDAESFSKADRIRQSLVSERAEPTQVLAAIEFAQAQLDLLRVRSVRGQMMAERDSLSGDHVRRLAALDRYEARALARRSRASAQLKFT